MHSIGSPALWLGFLALVFVMLALDLGVFNRKDHIIGFREALGWSGVWVAISLTFNAFIWVKFGAQQATDFLTGYLIEKSLSIDNIFVFVVIFGSLRIPAMYQHRVLYWGILSALVLRAAMIFAGTAAISRFHWLMYVFGAFLIITGIKLFAERSKVETPEEGWAMRQVRRLIPSTKELHGHRFVVKQNGKWLATPLLMTLLLIEISDVIFAVDSIPAIFAVTLDPFIVFTSNIFAILGLRALFFAFAGLLDKFHYLKVGLSAILIFVGIKMTIVEFYKIPSLASLFVIISILVTAIVASLLRPPNGITAPTQEGSA